MFIGKGKLLQQLSAFWFRFQPIKVLVPNHFITSEVQEMPAIVQKYAKELSGRAMMVKKLKILPVEAIFRGYLTGSAMVEYKQKMSICDIPLPPGLVEASELPRPLFTPSTKAAIGSHDENISIQQLKELIGAQYAQQIENIGLKLYTIARDYAKTKNIIIADTKFEFGVDENGVLHLADEVLTPDSSRFWPLSEYRVGTVQKSYYFLTSFDKQYLRDYLKQNNLNGKDGVELPQDVVQKTLDKYSEVISLLTGQVPNL